MKVFGYDFCWVSLSYMCILYVAVNHGGASADDDDSSKCCVR